MKKAMVRNPYKKTAVKLSYYNKASAKECSAIFNTAYGSKAFSMQNAPNNNASARESNAAYGTVRKIFQCKSCQIIMILP